MGRTGPLELLEDDVLDAISLRSYQLLVLNCDVKGDGEERGIISSSRIYFSKRALRLFSLANLAVLKGQLYRKELREMVLAVV